MGIWLAALLVLGIVLGAIHFIPGLELRRGLEGVPENMGISFGYLDIGFTIAVLCGMVIRRGITAGLVAVVF